MENLFQKFIDANVLREEDVSVLVDTIKEQIATAKTEAENSLKESLEQEYQLKLEEQSTEIETKLAAEFSEKEKVAVVEMTERFEQDKESLVTALEETLKSSINDVVEKSKSDIDALQESNAKLKETIVRLEKANTRKLNKALKETEEAAKAKEEELSQQVEVEMGKAIEDIRAEYEQRKDELQEQVANQLYEKTKELENSKELLAQKEKELVEQYNGKVAELQEQVHGMIETKVRALSESKDEYEAMLAESESLLEHMFAAERDRLRESTEQVEARKFELDKLVETYHRNFNAAITEQAKVIQEKAQAALDSKTRMLDRKMNSLVESIQAFVTSNLEKEISGLHEDRDNLQSLIKNAKDMIDTKVDAKVEKIVESTAVSINEMVTDTLKEELSQLHDDIERHRENEYGRRMFEAMRHEYQYSHFGNNSAIKSIKNDLKEAREQLLTTSKRLTEVALRNQVSDKRVQILESQASRSSVLNELLGALAGKKRAAMRELLSSVKTEALRESFDSLLPSIMESAGDAPKVVKSGKNVQKTRQKLNESETNVNTRNTIAISGDKYNQVSETLNVEDTKLNEDLNRLAFLSGIKI